MADTSQAVKSRIFFPQKSSKGVPSFNIRDTFEKQDRSWTWWRSTPLTPQRQGGSVAFEASLIYLVSSRIAKAM